MCPKTCNVGRISSTRCISSLQPTCVPSCTLSRILSGGPCVILKNLWATQLLQTESFTGCLCLRGYPDESLHATFSHRVMHHRSQADTNFEHLPRARSWKPSLPSRSHYYITQEISGLLTSKPRRTLMFLIMYNLPDKHWDIPDIRILSTFDHHPSLVFLRLNTPNKWHDYDVPHHLSWDPSPYSHSTWEYRRWVYFTKYTIILTSFCRWNPDHWSSYHFVSRDNWTE